MSPYKSVKSILRYDLPNMICLMKQTYHWAYTFFCTFVQSCSKLRSITMIDYVAWIKELPANVAEYWPFFGKV